jgi:hypothetical protein
MEMVTCRARRRSSRGLERTPMASIKKLQAQRYLFFFFFFFPAARPSFFSLFALTCSSL